MDRESPARKLLQFAQEKRIFRARDVQTLGLPRRLLSQLVASGQLQRLGRGLYVPANTEPTEHQSLAEVAKRVPKSVICLLSALRFHEIGTQAPFDIWIALPAGTHAPKLDTSRLRVIRLAAEAFSEGIETHVIAGTPVRIYSAAKTITDCFKFRNKIGIDVALEALKDAWRERKVTMDDLWRYAEVNRVKNVMRPYLEALTV